jgi:hypothetical protein
MENRNSFRDAMSNATKQFLVLTLHYNNSTFHSCSRKLIDDIETISDIWQACECYGVSVTDEEAVFSSKRLCQSGNKYYRKAANWEWPQNLGARGGGFG